MDVASGAILSAPTSVSDETGHAGAVWALGTVAGPQKAFASIESRGNTVTVEFSATATPGAAVDASIVADSVLLSASGETAFLGPTYTDQYGNLTTGAASWISRDPLVASAAVDGLVTGVGAGATWIVGSLAAPAD